MSRAVTFSVSDREWRALRQCADAAYNGSLAELVRDSLRHCGFRIQARAAMPPRGSVQTVTFHLKPEGGAS